MAKRLSRPVLSRPAPDKDIVFLQDSLAAQGYFKDVTPNEGLFCDVTEQVVKLFQSQHIDQDGKQLYVDGEVGEKTWWALLNPAGNAQRNGYQPYTPEAITDKRKMLLDIIFEEHAKDIREIPNGSNRSPEIDKYWGSTGVIGLPWCCAFVSWSLNATLGRLPIGNLHHLGVMRMWQKARALDMAASEPKPGDIFIQDVGGGKGHTGFVIGVSKDGYCIYTCEGNSGNRLKIGKRDKTTIDHYIDALNDGQGLGFSRIDFDVKNLADSDTR